MTEDVQYACAHPGCKSTVRLQVKQGASRTWSSTEVLEALRWRKVENGVLCPDHVSCPNPAETK